MTGCKCGGVDAPEGSEVSLCLLETPGLEDPF